MPETPKREAFVTVDAELMSLSPLSPERVIGVELLALAKEAGRLFHAELLDACKQHGARIRIVIEPALPTT